MWCSVLWDTLKMHEQQVPKLQLDKPLMSLICCGHIRAYEGPNSGLNHAFCRRSGFLDTLIDHNYGAPRSTLPGEPNS